MHSSRRRLGTSTALLVLLITGSQSVLSQKAASRVDSGTGTVSGQVSCMDTNAPARFAVVTLEPMPGERHSSEGASEGNFATNSTATTDMQGRFVMDKVAVGRYYVLASLPGYVNPLAGFEAKQLSAMDEETQKELAKRVQIIRVDANQVVTVALQLEHASEVSGAVLYDDGSPAVGIRMQLLRRKKDGEMSEVNSELIKGLSSFGSDTFTDDRGRYRLIGTPPGKYTVKATLPALEIAVGGLLGGSGSSVSVRGDQSAQFSLYLGDKFRAKSARVFQVGRGEQIGGLDFTIPVNGLHTVTGTLTAAHDGHLLNFGEVELLFADEREQARSTHVELDGSFRFSFVGEGKYILRASGAEDGEVVESPSGPFASVKAHSMKAYGEVEIPLMVQSDVSGLVLSAPDAAVNTAAQP